MHPLKTTACVLLMKVADKNRVNPLKTAGLGIGFDLAHRQITAESHIGFLEAALEMLDQRRTKWKSAQKFARDGIFAEFAKGEILSILPVDLIAVTEEKPLGSPVDRAGRTPGKNIGMVFGQVVFMVALDEADRSPLFLASAPCQKLPVQFVLITGQGHPKIENIPQKNQVVIAPGKGIQHAEKRGSVSAGLADMGVGDEDQGFSSSEPRISSVSIHITLMIPKAQASKTPRIHAKYHIYCLSF